MKSFNCGQISRACNPGHNILEHYNILVQIRFTTNKRKLDIQYSKRGIRIASRVAERLNMKFGWTPSLVPSLPSITQTLRIAVKKQAKTEPNFSFPVQFYCITPFCSKHSVWDCLSKQFLVLTRSILLPTTTF